MARGPVPKSTRSRRDDDTKRQCEMVEVVDTGELAGPELPEGALPNRESWHRQTQQLWDELRKSPLMQGEPLLTWQFMIDTMALHHLAWQHGRWDMAPDLRLRLAKIGICPEDRAKLKIRVVQPAEQRSELASSANVADIASRRARLTTDSNQQPCD